MARIRTFKAELFNDEKLIQCSVEARFLFLGLLPHCDDLGRQQYSFANLKGKVFPSDDISSSMVDAMLQELADVGVIELYEFRLTPGRPAQRWLRIPHFLRHQVIDRPSHCISPPSPSETDELARLCRCAKPLCVKARKEIEESRNGHRKRKVFPRELSEDSESGQRELDDSRGFDEYSTKTRGGKEGKGKELNTLDGKSSEDIHTGETEQNEPAQGDGSQGQTNAENRRARSAALAEIATRILAIFDLEPKPLILDTLVRSIEIRARSKGVSEELAAQEISTRAAWIAGQGAPEDWQGWFYDARYAYVPQGDRALKDVRIEARPVCGGTRCAEGWEQVRIGETVVSRRCPDCVKLWREVEG